MEHDPLIVSLKQQPRAPRVPDAKRSPRILPVVVFVVALLLTCVAAGYYGFLYLNAPHVSGSAREVANETDARKEVADTIARVSELIVLPEGEEPTIATVTDPEKLKDQEFFKNAKVGHRVLLYTKARKAYLYDPDAHRLIEVAPITTELQ